MADWRGVELSDLRMSSERLDLRPFEADDADLVAEAMQAPAMHRFLVLPDPYTASDARSYVEDIATAGRRAGTGIEAALVERSSGQLIGAASLRLPGPRSTGAEIGYAVYPWGQGHGFAAEAAARLADWALGHGVARVTIRAAVTNLASVATALNAGFRFESIARRDAPVPSRSDSDGSHPGAVSAADGATFSRIATDPSGAVARAFTALPPGGLTDGVLGLRPVRPEEWPVLLDDSRDPEVRRWSLTGQGFSETEARSRAARAALDWLVGTSADLAMVDTASGQMAGVLTVRKAGPPGVAGLGYSVLAAWRGRGYTARALRLFTRWALADGGFNRLELGAKSDNFASQRAALSGGFVPDGIRARRLHNSDGTFADEVRFAVTK